MHLVGFILRILYDWTVKADGRFAHFTLYRCCACANSTNVTVTPMSPAVRTQSTGTWYCACRVKNNSQPNIETRNSFEYINKAYVSVFFLWLPRTSNILLNKQAVEGNLLIYIRIFYYNTDEMRNTFQSILLHPSVVPHSIRCISFLRSWIFSMNPRTL